MGFHLTDGELVARGRNPLARPDYTAEGRFRSIEPLRPGYEKVRRAAVGGRAA